MPYKTLLELPHTVIYEEETLKRWRDVLKKLTTNVIDDLTLQQKCFKGLTIKTRRMPPFIIGRLYAQYCVLINKMYESYMDSLQLQRDPYFQEIIGVIVRRIFELHNELTRLILNDYFYVDASLQQLMLTPFDIIITTPYCFTTFRKQPMEVQLQKMWAEETERRNYVPPPEPEDIHRGASLMSSMPRLLPIVEEKVEVVTQADIDRMERLNHIITMQKHERFRQFFIQDIIQKFRRAKTYVLVKPKFAPLSARQAAAAYIIKVFREHMKLKRKKICDHKRDILVGLVPDVFKKPTVIEDINYKIQQHRAEKRKYLHDEYYTKDEIRERDRLILFRKDGIISDISDEIIAWFKEWYYGYGFFPSYPYIEEGGTLLVLRGEYPTIEEQEIEDELNKARTKGKTKEQLKEDKRKEEELKEAQAELAKANQKKEAEQLFKRKCNPKDDPGYGLKMAEVNVVEAFIKYQQAWIAFDTLPPARFKDVVYGYLMPILTEDIMKELQIECRQFVDDLMRIELKVLIKAQQKMFKRLNWKYPRFPPRKRPKKVPEPKIMDVNAEILASLEPLFDMGIVRKCKTKFKDVFGDSNYAAYEYNILDPHTEFPFPGYGDVRRRLSFSCVFGIGVQEGASRRKTVMLLGPEHHGKSFMVDAVVGELNAIKIDVSPEVFSGKTRKVARMLTKVFAAARIFQPTVIYCRNVERLFYKKVPHHERKLKPKAICKKLVKFLQKLKPEDKVLFIGTCSNPKLGNRRLPKMFDEIILVPRLDYGTCSQYLYNRLQKIPSMPRDYCVSALANILQGFSFGTVIKLIDEVFNSERIIRLNVTPFDPMEISKILIEREMEPYSVKDYKVYEDWWLKNSSLRVPRAELEIINFKRAQYFEKERLRELKKQKEKEQKI